MSGAYSADVSSSSFSSCFPHFLSFSVVQQTTHFLMSSNAHLSKRRRKANTISLIYIVLRLYMIIFEDILCNVFAASKTINKKI